MKKLFLLIVVLSTLNSQLSTVFAKPVKPQTIYLYGFCTSFTDSAVYFTEVQSLDSMYIQKKTNFLTGRHELSEQFKEYMKTTGYRNPTCCITFAKTRKAAELKFKKQMKRYKKSQATLIIKTVPTTEFRFSTYGVYDEDRFQAMEEQPKKKEKKEKRPKGPKGGMPPGGIPKL